jgi:transposase
VRAYRRVIRRPRYRPGCSCPGNKPIVTAAPPPRVLPKGKLGVSMWAEILLDKYLLQRPTYRLLQAWRWHGLDLSLGTVTDGLRRLEPLFAPLYEALAERSQQQPLWHADETRWQVFVTTEGKVGHGWYLWVFHAADVVIFVLSPTRALDVPEGHLGDEAEGILVVDRHAAYKAIAQVQGGAIRLAFCWAHVRRDFLRVAQGIGELRDWGMAWVARIAVVYQLNAARLDQAPDSPGWTAAEQRLREQVATLAEQRDAELAAPGLPLAKAKVLTSLQTHWDGLTVFLDHPEVPMDNNTAERAQRGPVVGRKNYYGSGALWSGRLAAMLFSLFQTLCLWQVNPQRWLTAYLQACAEAGGKAPADAADYLPWNLTAAPCLVERHLPRSRQQLLTPSRDRRKEYFEEPTSEAVAARLPRPRPEKRGFTECLLALHRRTHTEPLDASRPRSPEQFLVRKPRAGGYVVRHVGARRQRLRVSRPVVQRPWQRSPGPWSRPAAGPEKVISH